VCDLLEDKIIAFDLAEKKFRKVPMLMDDEEDEEEKCL
jgi:hypothetical protein